METSPMHMQPISCSCGTDYCPHKVEAIWDTDDTWEKYTELKELCEHRMATTKSPGRMLRHLRLKLYLEYRYSREQSVEGCCSI